MPHPLLLGHRGARAVTAIPENTFPSFDLALEHGCDGFEFDVRLTRDGRCVICHDPRCQDVEIAQADADCLQQLPVLEDLLARYCRQAFFDIELKVSGLEEHTLVALDRYPPEHGFVISSFLPHVVRDLHARDAQVSVGILCETGQQLRNWRKLPITHVIPQHRLVSRALIQEVHAADKQLFTWTVNQQEDMVRLAEWGVDGIISDDTQLLVQTLAKKRS